jgi:hypothetical protein
MLYKKTSFTKIGNLELKIDMQYVRQAKLGKTTRKTT